MSLKEQIAEVQSHLKNFASKLDKLERVLQTVEKDGFGFPPTDLSNLMELTAALTQAGTLGPGLTFPRYERVEPADDDDIFEDPLDPPTEDVAADAAAMAAEDADGSESEESEDNGGDEGGEDEDGDDSDEADEEGEE